MRQSVNWSDDENGQGGDNDGCPAEKSFLFRLCCGYEPVHFSDCVDDKGVKDLVGRKRGRTFNGVGRGNRHFRVFKGKGGASSYHVMMRKAGLR